MPNTGNYKRQYRPGSKSARIRDIQSGRYTEERRAWAKTLLGQMVLMVYPEDEVDQEKKEVGDTVTIIFPQFRSRSITWVLSSLTGEELDVLRSFLNLALDTAETTIRARDKVAKDAFENGDDSFARVYRTVPEFVIRQGKVRADDKGLHDGSEDVSPGLRPGQRDDSPEGGIRGTGSGLVDNEPKEGSTEDLKPETD